MDYRDIYDKYYEKQFIEEEQRGKIKCHLLNELSCNDMIKIMFEDYLKDKTISDVIVISKKYLNNLGESL